MKKVSKILFSLALIIMLVVTATINVNAAETTDYSGYEEVEGDVSTTKNTNTSTKNTNIQNTNTQNTNTQNTNTENKADTATTSHPKTGVYNNAVCISIAAVTIIAIVIAYTKMKKYNY